MFLTLHTSTNAALLAMPDGCVLAIGNFDGVHLGHSAVIGTAREVAAQKALPLAVMTFEPHPRAFFAPDDKPFRLTLLPAKQRLMAKMGVQHLLALPFDAALAAMTAEEFIARILKEALDVRHVVVGADFTFGKARGGTIETLQAAGIDVTPVTPARCGKEEVFSSTRIRAHLEKGEFSQAEGLLGHAFDLEGIVTHGDKRGRSIGYPTANQDVSVYAPIPYGIYAVRVKVQNEDVWKDAVASYGLRPMFSVQRPILETYIFDFDREIYGMLLRVRPVAFLRPEMNFADLAALQAQINLDCLAAKAVLKSAAS
jgi:riboflavin kinase / FMN adenylyltransferase